MATPTQLGPYRLERELSRGAMGTVHLAVHVETGARHALKLMSLDLTGPEFLERFRLESESLARLNHPHVVRVHSADLSGANPYLVQELLEGGTLEERLQGGPLPVDEAVEIALKLADGLEAVHELGILHRDLKPENVLFDERGEPRLVDFGLALDAADQQRLTATGVLLGTPSYMAPEQARGQKTNDPRTDVYGLAAILYAMLTGEPPVASRGSLLLTLAAVADERVVPPKRRRAEIPASIDDVCVAALSKDMAQRPESIGALRAALDLARTQVDGLDRKLRPALLGLAAAVALLSGAIAVVAVAKRRPVANTDPGGEAPVGSEAAKALSPSERAKKELATGDAQAALDAAAVALERDEPANVWKPIRGQALLLLGKPSAAEEDLSGSWRAVCGLERERLSLLQHLGRNPVARMTGFEFDRELIDRCERLIRSAKLLQGLGPVGARLLLRVQSNVAQVLVDLRRELLRSDQDAIQAIFERTRALRPGGGRIAVDLANACLLTETAEPTLLKDEGLRQSAYAACVEALRVPDLPLEWRAVAWAGACRFKTHTPLVRFEDAELHVGLPLAAAQDTLLDRSYRELGKAWMSALAQGLRDDRSGAHLVDCWDQARRYLTRRVDHCRPGSMARLGAQVDLAYLYLAAMQVDEAEALLDDPNWPRKVRLRHAYLSWECVLLRADEVGEGLDVVVDEVKAWLHADPNSHYAQSPDLWCLLAALKHKKGWRESFHADLRIAENLPSPFPIEGYWRRLPWRSPEQTREEVEGRGWRRTLERALRVARRER